MFQKILSIFKKKEPQTHSVSEGTTEGIQNSESSEKSSTSPSQPKKIGILEKLNSKFPKFFTAFRFYLLLLINAALIATTSKFFLEYRDKSLKDSINNNQTLLVNVETDEIFVGTVFKSEEEKVQEQAAEIMPESLPPEPFSEIESISGEKPYKSPPISQEDITKSKISILFIELGLSKEMTLGVMDLGNQFSLGFTPYASDIGDWVEQANSKNFEVFMNIPMQANDYPYSDPGPFAMLHNLSIGENLSRLDGIIEKNKRILGLYSRPGESFTSSRSNFLPVLNQIKSKNLLFFNGNIDSSKTIDSYCSLVDIACSSSAVTIDSELTEVAIKKNLEILEGLALTQGSSIGIVRAYPITLKLVKNWADNLNPNNTKLVPLGAMIDFEYKIKNAKK